MIYTNQFLHFVGTKEEFTDFYFGLQKYRFLLQKENILPIILTN